MAPRPKRPQKQEALPPTPLDAQQRKLQEQERKLQERMAKYEKLIEEAPKIAEQRARDQREELLRRASRSVKTTASRVSLPDRRFGLDANVATPAYGRQTRAERRQGRMMFFVLLLGLAAAILYLYYTVTQG